MSKTESFRSQHIDLLNIAGEISEHLNVDELSKDAGPTRHLLSNLLGKLSVHLSMEDKILYPQLTNHSDSNVKTMAKKFIDEMGGIGEAVKNYKSKWTTPKTIQNDPATFISETKGILAALGQRIDKENNELYKMVDEL